MRIRRKYWMGIECLLAVVCISCGSSSKVMPQVASASTQAESDKIEGGGESVEEIGEDLWRRLVNQLNESGTSISGSGEYEIRLLIADGLKELESDGSVTESELIRAEDSLEKLGVQLVAQAEYVRGGGEPVIDGALVRAVGIDVCPLYPFC